MFDSQRYGSSYSGCITSGMICAAVPEMKGVCNGDSGKLKGLNVAKKNQIADSF